MSTIVTNFVLISSREISFKNKDNWYIVLSHVILGQHPVEIKVSCVSHTFEGSTRGIPISRHSWPHVRACDLYPSITQNAYANPAVFFTVLFLDVTACHLTREYYKRICGDITYIFGHLILHNCDGHKWSLFLRKYHARLPSFVSFYESRAMDRLIFIARPIFTRHQ